MEITEESQKQGKAEIRGQGVGRMEREGQREEGNDPVLEFLHWKKH